MKVARLFAALCGMLLASCGGPAATPSPETATVPSTAHPTPSSSTAATPTLLLPVEPSGAPSVRLALPSNWQQIERTAEGLRATADLVRDSNPHLAALLEKGAMAGAADAFELIAVGYDGTRPMGIMNVGQAPASGMTLDQIESGLADQPIPSGVSDLVWRRVTLPIGEALRASGLQAITRPDGSTASVTETAYYLVVADEMIRVDFFCYPETLERCERDVEALIQDLQLALP